jgi:hypothetical protein
LALIVTSLRSPTKATSIVGRNTSDSTDGGSTDGGSSDWARTPAIGVVPITAATAAVASIRSTRITVTPSCDRL